MLEGILEGFLMRYLSKYLNGINSKNLSLGIWSGLVSIENISINQKAIDIMGLPIKLSFSHIKKLTIKIPWKTILMTSAEITLEGLYIVMAPVHKEGWGRLLSNSVKTKIQMIENFAEAYLNRITAKQMKQSSNNGLFQRILAKIVENLKISVKHIHIRFEDYENKFCFGFTL